MLGFGAKTPVYFWLVLLWAPLVSLAHAWAPNQPWLKGQSPAIVLGLVLATLALLTWVPYSAPANWSRLGGWTLLVALLLWGWELARTISDGAGFNYLAILPPVFLLLVLLRRPQLRNVSEPFSIIGVAIVAVAFAAYVLGLVGAMPDGFDGPEGGIPTRFPILGDLIGAQYRWIGPFSSVNYTAAAGGLAVAVGLASRRWARITSITGGIAILVLTQGDSATFAALAALVLYGLWHPKAARLVPSNNARAAIIVVLVVVAGAVMALRDGALGIRATVWENFAGLWASSPLLGVGTSGVNAFINAHDAQTGFIPYTHAHSVLLNGLTLYGIPWLVSLLFVLGAAFFSALRATESIGPGPLAVVAFVLFAGLAETIYTWGSWSLYASAILAVLVVADPGRRDVGATSGGRDCD